MVTLNQYVLKIVITFGSNKSKNQITNYLTNTVWDKLETKIDTKMDNNFDVGWSKIVKLKIIELANNAWEAYPKFAISGTTSLTASQLRSGMSDLLADLKVTLKAEFESNGATNVKFHIRYLDSRALTGDEF